MNLLRSRSSASERVSGECGEPAKTTTSVLEPFFARRACRLALWDRLLRRCQIMTQVPVPTKATMAAVRARWRDIQSLLYAK